MYIMGMIVDSRQRTYIRRGGNERPVVWFVQH